MERTHAIVQSEVCLHQLINGLEQLAEEYPLERLSLDQINRIMDAALLMKQRRLDAGVKELAKRTLI